MNLHTNKKLFYDAVMAASEEFRMAPEFIEKDYWICQILQKLSRHSNADRIVWKGGTSLSKAYGLIKRFSSDVDFAVLTEDLSQNRQKKLVSRIGKDTTIDLEEIVLPDKTIKNNRYRKTYHGYKSVIQQKNSGLTFLGNHVIVEINTYGNPYPYTRRIVQPFIAEMITRRNLNDMFFEYDMMPFALNVLDKRRTLCEKIVSLLRFSFEDNPAEGVASKIRHFYDLYYLCQDKECREFLSTDFRKELTELIAHDKKEFDKPTRWRDSPVQKSPLLTDFRSLWIEISAIYRTELGALSYGELPHEDAVESSTTELLSIVKEILG